MGLSDDSTEMARRIRAAAAAARTSRDVYEDALRTRNRLIVEACDAGYRWVDVARWSGVSAARITQLIVATTERGGAAPALAN